MSAMQKIGNEINSNEGVETPRTNCDSVSTSKTSSAPERTPYLDYLRVFASFAVMIIHSVSFTWYTPDLNDFGWKTYFFFDAVNRWSVPVFVMISGALFLSRNIPLKTLFSKYILRLTTAYLFWAVFYALTNKGNLTMRFYSFLNGPFHLWFVMMMIGLYLCLPILGSISTDKKRTEWFLLLALVFGFFLPWVLSIIKVFGGSIINRITEVIANNINKMHLNLATGYTGYFLLGYYFSKNQQTGNQKRIIYAFGILGFLLTVGLTYAASVREGHLAEIFFDYLTVNVLLSAAAIFIWFRQKNYTNFRVNALMYRMSKYSFGAYCIHMFVLNNLNKLHFPWLFPNPVFRVLCTALLVFTISYTLSALLNHIPFLKKYIV